MQNICICLMAAGGSGFNFAEFCLWAGAFALVMILVFIVVMVLRKKILLNSNSAESGYALTIEQLEQMHDKGMISDEEFTVMRRGIMGVGTPEKKTPESENDN